MPKEVCTPECESHQCGPYCACHNIPNQSQKQDSGKAPLHLLDPVSLEQLARVLEFGAKKYSPNGWRGGVQWTRTLSALLRHTMAFAGGQTHDPETGLNHMAHVMCNAMFLVNFEDTHPELDDRYRSDIRDKIGKWEHEGGSEFNIQEIDH